MMETMKPIKLGEKTAKQVLDASQIRQQAEVVRNQADSTINAIGVTLRETHGLPDSWQFSQQPDGLYLVDTAGGATAAAIAPEDVAMKSAAEAKRALRRVKRKGQVAPVALVQPGDAMAGVAA